MSTSSTFPATAPHQSPPDHPVRDTYHGVEVMDEFRWLEDGNDPAVRKWTDTQNRRTEFGKALTAAADPAFHHLKAFDLAPHQDKLVINTGGIREARRVAGPQLSGTHSRKERELAMIAKAFRRSRCNLWKIRVMQMFQ